VCECVGKKARARARARAFGCVCVWVFVSGVVCVVFGCVVTIARRDSAVLSKIQTCVHTLMSTHTYTHTCIHEYAVVWWQRRGGRRISTMLRAITGATKYEQRRAGE